MACGGVEVVVVAAEAAAKEEEGEKEWHFLGTTIQPQPAAGKSCDGFLDASSCWHLSAG